jgi:hypothetical protein
VSNLRTAGRAASGTVLDRIRDGTDTLAIDKRYGTPVPGRRMKAKVRG